VEAARDVRARLSKLKLKSFLKTSGGKGLTLSADQADTLERGEGFRPENCSLDGGGHARTLHCDRHEKRPLKTNIHRLSAQQSRGNGSRPYSTRARPGAPVSVPIEWSELGSLKSANQYTVLNLMQRLARQRKDPWTGIGRVKQGLPKRK
jgi:bifunctional non-homologous end joining protein LigD